MAFASFNGQRGAAPMAEINMVPLIDVMLVLLVIFIVTAPLLTHAVKLELPRASSSANELKPDKIEFAIDAAGQRFFNGEPVDRAEAARRFAQAVVAATGGRPQPELHLRADQAVAYRAVAETLADAGRAGLTRIGFV
ncbi:MAG: biopolymer transporter ExbD, partial [Burkholderiaceae bacterium]|nr:biopolymer transporter ExbD [Burkholderiaceae bacterium]